MKYWENQPVKLTETFEEIELINLQDAIYRKIEKEITNNNSVNLDYTIVEEDSLDDIHKFINSNYKTIDSTHSLVYGKDILKYIFKDSILIVFYPKNRATPIGFICGTRKTIRVADKKFCCIEVNLLCLVKQLRDIHISSYMINVLNLECIKKYKEVSCAFYTTGIKLQVPNYCYKRYYLRPINIEAMIKAGIINQVIDIKTYNDIGARSITMINGSGCEKEIIEKIEKKLSEYDDINYDICFLLNEMEIKDIMSNKDFYNFMFKDLTDFVMIYRVDAEFNGEICRFGYLYKWFFENEESKIRTMKMVINYCKKNDIFDTISVLDTLDIDYEELQFLRGTTGLNYYGYNIKLPKIKKHRNGLITV